MIICFLYISDAKFLKRSCPSQYLAQTVCFWYRYFWLANIVYPDQTVPQEVLWSALTLLAWHGSTGSAWQRSKTSTHYPAITTLLYSSNNTKFLLENVLLLVLWLFKFISLLLSLGPTSDWTNQSALGTLGNPDYSQAEKIDKPHWLNLLTIFFIFIQRCHNNWI